MIRRRRYSRLHCIHKTGTSAGGSPFIPVGKTRALLNPVASWRERANRFDVQTPICSAEQVHASRLQTVLKNLSDAVRETEAVLEAMRAEHDPLAVHIFISRRQFRNLPDTKSGSRREVAARLSWQTACELGFRGSLGEWERLMGAVSER
jgi:hypothetical protein